MNTRVLLPFWALSTGVALCLSNLPQLSAQQEAERPAEEVVSPTDSDTNEIPTAETADSVIEENNQSSDEPKAPSPAEEAFQRAMQHEEKNELQEAIAHCTEAILLDPDNLEYLNGRAHLYGEVRNQELAMADAARVLELDPTNIRARTLRGRMLERSGDVEKALIEFNTAVEQNPTSLEALAERQYYFERQGQSDKAKEDAERMVQLEPDSARANVARALSGSTDDQRINFASAAIQQDPENWNAYKLRGLSRAVEGDFAGATSDFEKALELSPNNALVISARGAMHYMEGDYEKSLEDSQKAAALEPRNCSIIAILADRLATCPNPSVRDAAKASEYAAEALRLDPHEPLVWRACASAAAANGSFDEAKKWQERALNSNILSPNQKADAQERLVAYNSGQPYVQNLPPVDEVLADKKIKRAREAIKNGNFDLAIVLCSEVIRTNDKKAFAYNVRGFAYYKNNDYGPAIADFTRAVEINPKDANSFFYRARSFEKTDQYGKALEDLVASYKADPSDIMMDNDLAWFLATCPDAHVRDGGRAAEYIDRALELRPNSPEAWDTCAAVFAEDGDFEDAVDWERAYIDRTDIGDDKRREGEQRLSLYEQQKPFRKESGRSADQLTVSTTPAPPGK